MMQIVGPASNAFQCRITLETSEAFPGTLSATRFGNIGCKRAEIGTLFSVIKQCKNTLRKRIDSERVATFSFNKSAGMSETKGSSVRQLKPWQ